MLIYEKEGTFRHFYELYQSVTAFTNQVLKSRRYLTGNKLLRELSDAISLMCHQN